MRNTFNKYGEITSINLLHDRKCGFITFGLRENAEQAMTELYDMLYLNKKKCELNWARSKPKPNVNGTTEQEMKENINTNMDTNTDNNVNVEEEKKYNDQNVNNKTNEYLPNDVNHAAITEEEKEYLAKKGILPPKLPPLPDPCATNSASYCGQSGTQYKSMTAHYQESKV